MFEYCSIVWTSDFRKSYDDKINAVFLFFLKNYLGIPKRTTSSIVYFITGTRPLTETLLENPLKQQNSINLSFELDFENFLLKTERTRSQLEPYQAENEIPQEFLLKWNNKRIAALPTRFQYRRNLCMELVDGYHRKTCMNDDFHLHAAEKCLCEMCGYQMKWYHKCEDFDHPLLLYLDSLNI